MRTVNVTAPSTRLYILSARLVKMARKTDVPWLYYSPLYYRSKKPLSFGLTVIWKSSPTDSPVPLPHQSCCPVPGTSCGFPCHPSELDTCNNNVSLISFIWLIIALYWFYHLLPAPCCCHAKYMLKTVLDQPSRDHPVLFEAESLLK